MDLIDVARIVLKRWYVTVAVLWLGLGVTYLVSSSIAPTYSIETQTLLVAARPTQEEVNDPMASGPANPFLLFSGSMDITAAAVARTVDGAEYRQRIAEEGFQGDYEFEPATDAPLIITVATADSPEQAAELDARVQEALAETLRQLQAEQGVESSDQIALRPLTTSAPTQELGDRNRVLVGILGVTVAASIGAAVLLESLMQHRKRVRDGDSASAAVAAAPSLFARQTADVDELPIEVGDDGVETRRVGS